MAQDLNVVALVGRLTRPCEIRYSNSGYAICSFSIAVNRRKKQQDGTWQDEASFFDCTLFGKLGESLSQYLQKGQQVSIQGSLNQETWDDKTTGQKRSKVGVVVDSISLIGGSNNDKGTQNARQPQRQQTNGSYQQRQAQGQYTQQQPRQQSVTQDEFVDENVPF